MTCFSYRACIGIPKTTLTTETCLTSTGNPWHIRHRHLPMPDKLTPEQRHRNMSRIRSRDTKPEKKVRQTLFRSGFRYRLNVRNLPGTPDIVLPKYRTAIFVNGCFWHGHKGCKYYTVPSTNVEFWMDKVRRNKERDDLNNQRLESLSWSIITIW